MASASVRSIHDDTSRRGSGVSTRISRARMAGNSPGVTLVACHLVARWALSLAALHSSTRSPLPSENT